LDNVFISDRARNSTESINTDLKLYLKTFYINLLHIKGRIVD